MQRYKDRDALLQKCSENFWIIRKYNKIPYINPVAYLTKSSSSRLRYHNCEYFILYSCIFRGYSCVSNSSSNNFWMPYKICIFFEILPTALWTITWGAATEPVLATARLGLRKKSIRKLANRTVSYWCGNNTKYFEPDGRRVYRSHTNVHLLLTAIL